MRNLYILLALSIGFFNVSQSVSTTENNYNSQKNTGVNSGSTTYNRLFACTPVATFSEDFNTIAIPNLPTCWENRNGGTVSTQAADANSSPNALYMASPSDDKDKQAIVAMPTVSNLSAGTHRLRFSMRAVSTLGGVIEVGTLANSLNPNTFDVITSITASSFTYQSYIVAPGIINGKETLAFRHTGKPTSGVLIDDVVWEPIPLCIAPTGINAVSFAPTSAAITWNTPTTTPINYDVYLSTSNVAPTDNTTSFASAVATPYTATGLAAGTTYNVWVRTNCGTNGKSSWSAVQQLTTACSGAALPYALNFDAVTAPAVPNCVTIQNVNNDNRSWQTAPAPIGYTGNVMSYIFNPSSIANDWFFTQGLNLTAGKSYILSYKFGNNSTAFTEKLKVAFGTSASANSMVNVIADYPAVNDNFPRVHKIRFTAPTSGVYFVGFQVYSAANQFQLYVDEISVNEATVAPTTANTCVNVTVPRIDEQSNTKWMALVDAAGNIIGEINGNGNNLGDVTAKVYRNSGPLRKDFYGRYYLDRNIEITPTRQPTTPVSVRLYFTATEFTALRTEPNSNVASFTGVSIFKNNDACGAKLNGGAAKLTTTTAQYESDFVSTFSVNSFSSFYFAASSYSALPATIVSFSGSRQGNANNLRWTVAQEVDILEYEVERSDNNGTGWYKVGNIVAVGNTTSQHSYGFTDQGITGLKQLYRLRQVDRSGVAKLSTIVSISSAKPTKLVLSSLFPNPAASRLNMVIDAPQKDNILLEVLDAVGRTIKWQKNAVEAGSNTIQLNVSNLAMGTYFIRVSCANNCETTNTKFVKE
ncbi:MAG: T9SS type A sorting domain-containing protein [Chitinophagaceae bacterium]|nr:MAG: T9SS type A sorting domain-containing protein [Chitinophagaceae bacterium]